MAENAGVIKTQNRRILRALEESGGPFQGEQKQERRKIAVVQFMRFDMTALMYSSK